MVHEIVEKARPEGKAKLISINLVSLSISVLNPATQSMKSGRQKVIVAIPIAMPRSTTSCNPYDPDDAPVSQGLAKGSPTAYIFPFAL